MAQDNVRIIKGNILLFFCYELAHGVKVDTLEKLLMRQETEGVLSLRRSKSHYLRFESYPLVIKLGEEELDLKGKERVVMVQARVFDFGVVSICLKMQFAGSFQELAAEATAISESDAFLRISGDYLSRIQRLVAPALQRPIESDLVEDYVIFHVSELDEPISGQQLLDLHGKEIAMTLRAEQISLSDQEVANALANSISYYREDVLVVDWDRAFLYDKEHYNDHINIIEFANTQLLDMRYYDRWLDGELDVLYRELQSERLKTPLLRVARYRRLSTRTMLLMTDMLGLIDQIDNSLKAIDTLYAARVHRAISRRLYLDEWKRGLDRKLEALRSISNTLNATIYNQRSTILELSIVILIIIEIIIVLAFAAIPK
jgi:hypothetical protein